MRGVFVCMACERVVVGESRDAHLSLGAQSAVLVRSDCV